MIRIGIICPSEIAFRRFLPSLMKAKDDFQFAGVAIANPEEWFGDLTHVSADEIQAQQDRERAKAQTFVEQYGGQIYEGYHSIIQSPEVDAMYIPLPPALHCRTSTIRYVVRIDHSANIPVHNPAQLETARADLRKPR